MDRCAYQQNALAACDVVCPRPRRFGPFNPAINDHIRPSRCPINNSYQVEISDSKAGAELLDMILTKGNYGAEKSNTNMATSPPFFCGSPPSRALNPVIQDARFNSEKQLMPLSPPSTIATSPSSSCKGSGCVRTKFGHNPATVRIEGFNCLGRDGQNRSISAVA